jgi:hypothetical protein
VSVLCFWVLSECRHLRQLSPALLGVLRSRHLHLLQHRLLPVRIYLPALQPALRHLQQHLYIVSLMQCWLLLQPKPMPNLHISNVQLSALRFLEQLLPVRLRLHPIIHQPWLHILLSSHRLLPLFNPDFMSVLLIGLLSFRRYLHHLPRRLRCLQKPYNLSLLLPLLLPRRNRQWVVSTLSRSPRLQPL